MFAVLFSVFALCFECLLFFILTFFEIVVPRFFQFLLLSLHWCYFMSYIALPFSDVAPFRCLRFAFNCCAFVCFSNCCSFRFIDVLSFQSLHFLLRFCPFRCCPFPFHINTLECLLFCFQCLLFALNACSFSF
eukprot:Selendium_serpulae@DN40_c0_g1_i1.p1